MNVPLAVPVSVLFTLGLAPLASAQVQAFPLTATSRTADDVALTTSLESLVTLAKRTEVRLTQVPVPGAKDVELDLRRVRLHVGRDAIHVDGRTGGSVDPSLSLWSGGVVGQPGSVAFLAFSRYGSRGWFGMPGKLVHLLAEAGPNNNWSRARIANDRFVARSGNSFDFRCDERRVPGIAPVLRSSASVGPNAGPLPVYDAPIAFETDYEFYALFNNLDAAKTYALSLIGAVSDMYRRDVGVIFTLPYLGFHTKNNDPWTSNDCFTRLSQFRSAWRNGNAPVRAQLYHMISGVKVNGCGGVAYLNVICNQSAGFGMSAHINTRLTFPPKKGPLTWDFFVLAHELGHEFGSPHTHEYNPKIDDCANGKCRSNGTIMSYCHTCQGGMNNIDLRFDSRVATTIRNAVLRSCLKQFDGVLTADLGFALTGSNGTPAQSITFVKPAVRVAVTSAPKNRPGLVVIGARQAPMPFLGGTLVPSPDIAAPIVADANGDVATLFPAPGSFPTGVTVYVQSWFLDPAGPKGFAATNATRVELIRP